ncbi:hypothetical protein L6164_028935 [Bauhinia variegata]|uniref:Uncharacterized protein n=1 Tax=Bauhinia variegata TaxID=167791 RepID=A0ACB9L744_BAUVA|nr:hypothetical protein L6164_028935 [Bauhinia variegata]
MRGKGVRRLNATAAVRRIPPFMDHSEDVNDAAMPDTYSDSDDDLEDDRMGNSNDNLVDGMKEHSNGSPLGIPSHDYLCIDILDRNICLACNEGGEVLVCSEIGCPVSLHSKCIGGEPSFDNMGNFFCPYCQYKRAVAEVNELKNKALIEKKALSKFLCKNEVTGDKTTLKNGTVKRAEHQEVPYTGVKDFLDGCDRKGSIDVQSQPLQTEGDHERERIGTDYPRHDDEDLHETNLENRVEVESLNASPLRVLTLKDIEHNDEDIEEILQEEPRVPARDRSVSETFNSYSYSGAVSPRKRCFKNGANRIAYPQTFDSDRESTQQRKTSGTNACYQNLEVIPYGRLREPQGLPKQVTKETHAKRKRLRWTTEEESLLKEGVSRFSTQNHNIPWRKILEYGSNVFNSTRTPVDLKDKWRNVAKEVGSDTRERKRIKCLSYPYINSRPNHTNLPGETDDTGILHRSHKAVGSSIVAYRFSNESPSITKSGSMRFQRKWYRKCVNRSTMSGSPEFMSASPADFLSGLYSIAVDCMFPIENKNFDMVERFFCRYRVSHYNEEPESENKKETKSENKNQVGFTCLFLKFAPVVSVPSKEDLLATFIQFGPLKESEVQLLKDTGIAQIVFANCSDAGDAFCSVVQNKPFGTTLIDCKLHRPTSHLPRETLVTSAQPSGGSELHVVNYSTGTDMKSVCPSGPKSPPSGAPSVEFIRQKLQMMTSMLEKSGDTLSPQMRTKLKDDVKHLMSKVNSMTYSSDEV